jgi:hypothetical protein
MPPGMAEISTISCPVHLITHNKHMQFVTGAGYRAALAVCVAYWQAECPDKTMEAMNLALLGRMHAGQWAHVREEVLPILAAILPILRTTYAARVASRARLRAAQTSGGMARKRDAEAKAEKRRAALEPTKLNDPASPAIQHVFPATHKPYTNPESALTPQALAAIDADNKRKLRNAATSETNQPGYKKTTPMHGMARLVDD